MKKLKEHLKKYWKTSLFLFIVLVSYFILHNLSKNDSKVVDELSKIEKYVTEYEVEKPESESVMITTNEETGCKYLVFLDMELVDNSGKVMLPLGDDPKCELK